MMKFTVTTSDGVIENHAKILGDGVTLTAETASILKVIHAIDDGEILTDAFEISLEEVLDDKRES